MTKWQCVECGSFFDGLKPPDKCPGCNTSCTYADVTCYRPECGGPTNADPMIMDMITRRIGIKAPLHLEVAQPKETLRTVSVEKVTKAALFQGLNEDDIQEVLSIGQIKNYYPGDVVFKEGEEAAHIYIIEEGKLGVQTAEKQAIYTASAGDILGWPTLIAPPYKRTTSAVAVEKVRAVIIDQAILEEFCQKNLPIGYKITQNVARIAIRMKAMSMDMVYG